MELYSDQKVVVLAGSWFNVANVSVFSTPLLGTIKSFTDTTVTVEPNDNKFSRYKLKASTFKLTEVFEYGYYSRGYWLNLESYIEIPDPNESTSEITLEMYQNLEQRLSTLEKKYSLLSDHVQNKFTLKTTISNADL